MSTEEIRKRLKPCFRRLGVRRLPPLIFDGRRHYFSKWGLSCKGPWWYRLSPQRNRGVIGDVNGAVAVFSLWPEQPCHRHEFTHAGHSLREV